MTRRRRQVEREREKQVTIHWELPTIAVFGLALLLFVPGFQLLGVAILCAIPLLGMGGNGLGGENMSGCLLILGVIVAIGGAVLWAKAGGM